jgi:IS5 family transposase
MKGGRKAPSWQRLIKERLTTLGFYTDRVDFGKVLSVMRKAPKGNMLDRNDEAINRIIAMMRARLEHLFRALKRRLGHVKIRYRGIAKNRAKLFTLFALDNLFLVRRRLLT